MSERAAKRYERFLESKREFNEKRLKVVEKTFDESVATERDGGIEIHTNGLSAEYVDKFLSTKDPRFVVSYYVVSCGASNWTQNRPEDLSTVERLFFE